MVFQYGPEPFSFWPIGFNLPLEFDQYKEEYLRNPSPYILKPPMSSRGRGIVLAPTLDDVDPKSEFVRTKFPLAQKYIPNPILFEGHKITFRLYVALTSLNPLRVYVYPDGIARICSQRYSLDSFRDPLAHLTNYDLQMDCEEGFNREMEAVNSSLEHDGLRSHIKYVFSLLQEKYNADLDKLWADIHRLVLMTCLSAEQFFQKAAEHYVPKRTTSFEVMGWDLLVDTDMKPWLLEVNHTPSLAPHTNLENSIKSSMIRDLLSLVDIRNTTRSILIRETNSLFATVMRSRKLTAQKQRTCAWDDNGIKALQDLSYLDIWTIRETELEYERRGEWVRVFPNPDSAKYFPFFQCPNNRNKLVVHWLREGRHLEELRNLLPQTEENRVV